MTTPRHASSHRRKVVYAAITVFGSLLALEAGARLALSILGPGAAPLGVGFEAEKATIFEADPDLFWRLQPNLRSERGDNPRMIDVRTNAMSLRGEEIAPVKGEGTIRILALGDSCTFGSGARTDETYPARLQRQLRVSTAKRSFRNAEALSDSEYARALRPARRLALTRLAQRLRDGTGRARRSGAERATGRARKMRVSFSEYRENLPASSRSADRGRSSP